MKKIYFLLVILLAKIVNAQEVLNDPWQNILAVNLPQTGINYRTSTVVNNKVIMVVDTLPFGAANFTGLYIYDINSRNLGNISFTLDPGDRGVTCATSYKTSTPGLEYGIFGCFSNSNVGVSYPVVYTYNGQTNSIIADSLNFGSKYSYDGGIKNIIMFSPNTNNDSMRVFSVYNGGISVFTKHINQTSFTASYLPVNIDYINASYVHNNKLYIAGMYLDQPCLLESTDGRTFINAVNFNPAMFPQYSCVNNVISFNNQLYYSISLSLGDYHIFRFDNANNHILVQSTTSTSLTIKTFAVYKNRLWYSAAKNDLMSITAHITSIDATSNINISATDFGFQDVDGDHIELVTNNDSLYFIGTKGTFQASKSPIPGTSASMSLLNKYINIAKLNSPTASFNYNNNLICFNATESFTSTSQNTDSLRWIYDSNYYYAISPGSSATMNYNFGSVGSHTVGLIAFGGTLSDTTFLSVNVYSVSASITGPSNLCQGDSLHLTSNVTNGLGAINYNWYSNGSSFGTNTPNINTLSPLGTSTYYLMATDFHGCTSQSNTVTTITNILTNMMGTITSASVGVAGDLTLYKYEPILTRFDSVTTIPIGGFGTYTFSNLLAGDYILKAIPSSTSLQTTYYGTNAISWKDATPITHGCISPSTINIEVDSLVNIGTGAGVLTGSIYQGNGFGHRLMSTTTNDYFKPLSPGGPIGGIVVKGGRNPGGQMFVQTTTNAAGQYTLSGIPLGTGDDYFILVDIPGLDTNGTYYRTLTSQNPQINGLDFMVDSIYIYPIGLITAISSENSILENKILLFPNPAKELAIIEYELTESATIQIELFDLIGQKVKTIVPDSKQEKNKHKHSINTSNLNSGIYFVKLKINNSENVIKLIITN